MPIVKRTFSIPADISKNLNNTIPNQERSKFISQTIDSALRERKKEKLINTINNIKGWKKNWESVIETISANNRLNFCDEL